MKLVADVDASVVERVEDRLPALRQFLEGRLDQSGRALRPRIDIGPGERAGKRDVRRKAEVARRLGAFHHLVDGPFLPLGGLAVHLLGREGVERFVIGRVDRHQLALQMSRELGDLDAVARRRSLELVAIGLRRRRLGEIEQPSVPGWNLDALVSEPGRPFAHRRETVERRGVSGELRQKNRRSLDHASQNFLPGFARSAQSHTVAKREARVPASPAAFLSGPQSP